MLRFHGATLTRRTDVSSKGSLPQSKVRKKKKEVLQTGRREAGPCLPELKNESHGQQRVSKGIRFTEAKDKALKCDRGSYWVATKDFYPWLVIRTLSENLWDSTHGTYPRRIWNTFILPPTPKPLCFFCSHLQLQSAASIRLPYLFLPMLTLSLFRRKERRASQKIKAVRSKWQNYFKENRNSHSFFILSHYIKIILILWNKNWKTRGKEDRRRWDRNYG